MQLLQFEYTITIIGNGYATYKETHNKQKLKFILAFLLRVESVIQFGFNKTACVIKL
jgi:hypothetical protein